MVIKTLSWPPIFTQRRSTFILKGHRGILNRPVCITFLVVYFRKGSILKTFQLIRDRPIWYVRRISFFFNGPLKPGSAKFQSNRLEQSRDLIRYQTGLDWIVLIGLNRFHTLMHKKALHSFNWLVSCLPAYYENELIIIKQWITINFNFRAISWSTLFTSCS